MAFPALNSNFSRKHPTLGVLLLLSIPVAIILLGGFSIGKILNYRAEHTYLKTFYAQAAIAERQVADLPFQNLVLTTVVDGTTKTGRGKSLIKYCSTGGTYRNYQTDQTIYNARYCVKGLTKYYGVDTITSAYIDEVIQTMEAQGFVMNSDESVDNVKSRIINMYETGRGFSFKHSDGTYASVSFLNTAARNAAAANPDIWCDNGAGCKALRKANEKRSYPYYLAVSVTAIKNYTD